MRHPVIALLWRCWRLTLRWYVLILMIAIAGHLGIMSLSPPRNVPPNFPYREVLANGVVIMNFMLAAFTTLLAVTVGGRAGFPLGFELRLPVSMKLLVAVPMLYLGVACASLYVIPVLLSRLLFGIPIPLAPAAAMLFTIVVVLAAGSWSTTGSSTRTASVIIAILGLAQLFGKMRPLHFSATNKPGEPLFNPDMIALTPAQYGVLAVVCLAVFAFTVHRVSLQRRSESWQLLPASVPRRATESSGQISASSTQRRTFTDRVADLFSVPCPTSSPWRAELWLELKRHGMPVLALGVLLTLSLPLLILGAQSLGWAGIESMAWLPAAGVFFTGIGIAFFNRRVVSSGYMNAFEGTRGLGTLQLAGAQFLVIASTTFVGILLTSVSWWLSLPLLSTPGSVITKVQEGLAFFASVSLPAQASGIVVLGVMYLAFIALFAAVHSCSVFWGRKVLYGMMAFTLYCIAFIYVVVNGRVVVDNGRYVATDEHAELHRIQVHIWGFAVVVLLLTLLVLGRVIYLKLLTLKNGTAALAGWLAFVVCAWISLQTLGVDLTSVASELQALDAALLLLPLTLFLLTAWSYDKLRHR